MKLTDEHLAILRALDGFTDYVDARSVHGVAFPRQASPTIQHVGRRMDALSKFGLTRKQRSSGEWLYALTEAGRTALSAKEAE